jgi:hypothetical protein
MVTGSITLGIGNFFLDLGNFDDPLVKIHFFFQLISFKSGFHLHFLHLIVFSTFP